MQRIIVGILVVLALLTHLPGSAGASWLSNLLENGKLPPIGDLSLCVIAPTLCIANEVNKEELRKKEIERANETLKQRLVSYTNETTEFIKNLNIKSEEERLEVKAALNEADECLLKAKALEEADTCILNMRREIFRIHRKYQT